LKYYFGMIKITFSWDDGAPDDFKLAELSSKYNIPGMFFIPERNPERPVINASEVKQLVNAGFDVGAHTQSHLYLTHIPTENVYNEIYNGKTYLEEITGRPVAHFCLPGGFYNKQIIDISRSLFSTVRTAETGAVSISNQKNYFIQPAFHFYNRGIKSLLFNSFKHNLFLFSFILKNRNLLYFELLKQFVVHAQKQEKLYHVQFWGHSWELEQQGLWKELEDLFTFLNTNFADSVCTYDEFVKL